jgi:adenylate cyclase
MARRRRKRLKRRKPASQDAAERILEAADTVRATGERINRDPALLSIMRALRKVLPGDDRVADPLTLAKGGQPRAVNQMMSELTSERPGVLGEAGLGALQVWQSLSEAQGRGKGKTELAIVFTDLVDFSSWALEAGDEAAIELLRDVSVAIEPPVKAHGGRVVKRLGDGMMAVFDHADGALDAVLEGREKLGDLRVDGYQPRIRAGIHVGKPRKVRGDYFGVDVNVAARVADGASPGELLVSEQALAALDRDSLRVSKRDPFKAKGVPEDFRVYSVKPKR